MVGWIKCGLSGVVGINCKDVIDMVVYLFSDVCEGKLFMFVYMICVEVDVLFV